MVVKQDEIGNKRDLVALDEVIDDNFNFIKFLNDVRVKYNLSPTPLIEEDTTKGSINNQQN